MHRFKSLTRSIVLNDHIIIDVPFFIQTKPTMGKFNFNCDSMHIITAGARNVMFKQLYLHVQWTCVFWCLNNLLGFSCFKYG